MNQIKKSQKEIINSENYLLYLFIECGKFLKTLKVIYSGDWYDYAVNSGFKLSKKKGELMIKLAEHEEIIYKTCSRKTNIADALKVITTYSNIGLCKKFPIKVKCDFSVKSQSYFITIPIITNNVERFMSVLKIKKITKIMKESLVKCIEKNKTLDLRFFYKN